MLLLSILATALVAAGPLIGNLKRGPRSYLAGIPTTRVSRADVELTVLATGRVTSTQSTEISCTLERLNAPGQSSSLVSGASTILDLVPDGSIVKAGDILCELDASSFTELLRRQQIVVEQATADHMQASLALEVAQITLRSYQEGEEIQMKREFNGQIALAKADLARQDDRVGWVRKMLQKGYASLAAVRSEEQTRLRLETESKSVGTCSGKLPAIHRAQGVF